jgi:protocatechuate 3,4-dioxygenase beta subunit
MSSSRPLLVVVLLVAIAAVVFLVAGNPFAPKGDATDGVANENEAPSAVGSSATRGAPAVAANADPTLASGAESIGRGDVKVRLLKFRGLAPIVGQAVTVTLRAGETAEKKTDDQGRVLFTGLRASRAWTLSIEGPGFSPVEMKGVAVKSKETTDLGDLLLGDKVVLKGRVIDDRGRPIVGAAVSAYTGGGFDASQGIVIAMVSSALDMPLPNDEAQTDEQGLFTLGQLTPGRPYEVHAKHAGHALSVQTSLVVSPDRTMGLLTIVLGLGATVKGKVTDENGRPVDGATVIAMEDMGGGRMMPTTMKRDYAKTKPDGTYLLDTLSRGARYRFGVSAPNYAPVFDSMQSGLTVEAEATRDFQLKKGGSIEGVVTDKTTGQPVADARVIAVVGNNVGGGMMGGRGGRGPGGGRPTSGASGRLDLGSLGGPDRPPDDQASTQIVRTAPDGSFRMDAMVPGTVAIAQVKATGYADYGASSFPGSTTPSWGEVKAGETLKVAVQLEAGGSISGKVMAAGAGGTAPVAGAQVSVIVMSFAAMFTGFGTALTADDGSFKVEGIRPGKYMVTATASGFIAPDATATEAQVEMPEQGGVVSKDVMMSAAGAIEGVVTDTKGRPVGAARVRTRAVPQRGRGGFGGGMMRAFLPGGAGKVVLTDADGRYRLDSVGVGEKTIVSADSDEMVPSDSDPIEVRAGETREVNLTLSGGGTLKGRVIDDHGATVPNAKMRVGHLDADTDASPTLSAFQTDRLLDQRVLFSDNDGWFEIPRLQPGRTLVKVEKEGYTTSYRRDLSIGADEVRDNHMVTLIKGQTISGVVKGDDGKPVAGAFVAVTKQANPQRMGGGGAPAPADSTETSDGTVEPQMNDRADDQGRFTVEGIPPGPSYTVLVWFANGYRGYAAGDEGAIKRGIPTNARDVEFVLKKMPEGEGQFPMGGMPRPAGSAAGAGTMPQPIPRPPGGGTGGGAGAGMGGGTVPIPGMGG